MNPAQWSELLTEISRVLLLRDEWGDEDDVNRPRFSDEARAAGFIGLEGASESQIVAAETRLGVRFPPSYRAFLSVSNGWPQMWNSVEPGELWNTERIQWARDQDPNLVEVWSDNCIDVSPEEHLSSRGDELGGYRAEYVAGLLSISDHGDACEVLLCPEVRDENGEWECWKVGSWCGVERYDALEDWFLSVLEFYSDPSRED